MKNYLLVVGVCLLVLTSTSLGDLVGHWTFDEGQGNIAYDSASNNDGTITGANWTTNGKNGGALSFDGNNDYVQIPNNTNFNFQSGFSLCAWVKPALDYTDGRIIYRYDSTSGDGYFLSQSKNNEGSFGLVTFLNNNDPCVASDVHSVAGQWTSVVGVRENNGDMKIYVDGILQSFIRNHAGTIDSSGDLFIGVDYILQKDFNGLIDDVSIYNHALTSEEVTAIVPEPMSIVLLATGMIFLGKNNGRKSRLQ